MSRSAHADFLPAFANALNGVACAILPFLPTCPEGSNSSSAPGKGNSGGGSGAANNAGGNGAGNPESGSGANGEAVAPSAEHASDPSTDIVVQARSTSATRERKPKDAPTTKDLGIAKYTAIVTSDHPVTIRTDWGECWAVANHRPDKKPVAVPFKEKPEFSSLYAQKDRLGLHLGPCYCGRPLTTTDIHTGIQSLTWNRSEPSLDLRSQGPEFGQEPDYYVDGATLGRLCELLACGSPTLLSSTKDVSPEDNTRALFLPNPCAPCVFNGLPMVNGASVTAYRDADGTCATETRTCSGGKLSGSFAYSTCTPGGPPTCSFNGTTITEGGSVTAWERQEGPVADCKSEVRVCNGGNLSGSFKYANCGACGGTWVKRAAKPINRKIDHRRPTLLCSDPVL